MTTILPNYICFSQFVDENGFQTKSMLCMPIYNTERQIFGVTQLINKKNGAAFVDSDANIMEVSNAEDFMKIIEKLNMISNRYNILSSRKALCR